MYVKVISSDARNLDLLIQVNDADLVDHVRSLVQTQLINEGIQPTNVKLTFLNNTLKNGRSLSHYGVKNHSTIYAQLRPNSLPADKDMMETHPKYRKRSSRDYEVCDNCGVGGEDVDQADFSVCGKCKTYLHISCLALPLEFDPEHGWRCPNCNNDLNGTDIDLSDVDMEIQSSGISTKKAKKNRLKACTVVGPTHRGPVMGVEVGQSWRSRAECLEAGIHRATVAGIAGTIKTGAFSLVLSGGYPEDFDEGEVFTYTGSGGRDLQNGNRRTAPQTSDQKLTRHNLALAMTLDTEEINQKSGAESKNWRRSKKIRVVRSHKCNNKYAPSEGLRYDGIYKLVKYWPEKGERGFIVWRYLFRRDDPIPAPWTLEGKERIKELGLVMAEPLEPLSEIFGEDGNNELREHKSFETSSKELESYRIPEEVTRLIEKDRRNERVWNTILSNPVKDATEFQWVIFAREFLCPICRKIVKEPVTTHCDHNTCLRCLQLSMHYLGNICPICKKEYHLSGKFEFEVNNELIAVFRKINPAYDYNSSVIAMEEYSDSKDITMNSCGIE